MLPARRGKIQREIHRDMHHAGSPVQLRFHLVRRFLSHVMKKAPYEYDALRRYRDDAGPVLFNSRGRQTATANGHHQHTTRATINVDETLT